MKVRIGFVTNSSSSSFLIVGVGDGELIAQLLNAEKIEEVIHDYGVHKGKAVNFYLKNAVKPLALAMGI